MNKLEKPWKDFAMKKQSYSHVITAYFLLSIFVQLNVLSEPQEKDRGTARLHPETQGTLLTSKGKHLQTQTIQKEKQIRKVMERSVPRRAPAQPGTHQAIHGVVERSEGRLRPAFLRYLGGYGGIC